MSNLGGNTRRGKEERGQCALARAPPITGLYCKTNPACGQLGFLWTLELGYYTEGQGAQEGQRRQRENARGSPRVLLGILRSSAILPIPLATGKGVKKYAFPLRLICSLSFGFLVWST